MSSQKATGSSAGKATKGMTGTAQVTGKWSPLQLEVLTSNVDAYKTSGTLHGQAKKEGRKTVLATVNKAMRPLFPKLSKEKWEQVKSLVKSWFNQYARSRQPKVPYVGKMKWTMQRVAGHVLKAEVTSVAVDASGEKPGQNTGFLGHYQPALQKIVKGLDAEEQQEYQELADLWNKEGLPDDIKRKNADKSGRKWVQEMAEHGWKTYGMRMIIFEGHFNKQGEAVHSTHDFNDRIGSPTISPFIEQNEEALETFETEWAGYALGALLRDAGRTEGEGAAAPGSRKRLPAELIEMDRDSYGLPIIPTQTSMKGANLDQLIRSFLTIHYRLVSQKRHIRPPWLLISEAQEDFVSAEYIPELCTLREPSRMKVSEKASLLNFWRDRQAHSQVKHAFLWTAFHNGESMVQRDYIIHSSEDSDGPGRTKTKIQKKKKGGKKQKVKVAAASQSSDPELLDPRGTEPIQKTRTKKMSRERRAEQAVPTSESESQLGDLPIINSIKMVKMKQSSRKGKAKAVTPSGESESDLVDSPISEPLLMKQTSGIRGKAKLAGAAYVSEVGFPGSAARKKVLGKEQAKVAKVGSDLDSEIMEVLSTKPIKTAARKQVSGTGMAKTAARSREVDAESGDPPMTQGGMMSRKAKETAAVVGSCSESSSVHHQVTKHTKITTAKQTTRKGKEKAAETIAVTSHAPSPNISLHAGTLEPESDGVSGVETSAKPSVQKVVKKRKASITSESDSVSESESEPQPTTALFDKIEDLTGIQRTRTPSKKRMEMEEISDTVKVHAKKRKVKQPAVETVKVFPVKTTTLKPAAVAEEPTGMALNTSGARPKPRRLKKS